MPPRMLLSLVALACAVGCAPDESPLRPAQPADSAAPTNRIELSAETMANVGITFTTVASERLAEHLEVPGQLVVPESRRVTLRAPAAGRVLTHVERWSELQADAVVIEMVSPALAEAQSRLVESSAELIEARIALAQADAEAPGIAREAAALSAAAVAGGARMAAAEAHLAAADAHHDAARRRLEELDAAGAGGLGVAQRITLQREHVEAAQLALDAAAARDALGVSAAQWARQAAAATTRVDATPELLEQARRRVLLAESRHAQAVTELGLLAGVAPETLMTAPAPADDAAPAWSRLATLTVRAPRPGLISELEVAAGQWVEAGDVLAVLIDLRELVFRGRVPEDDAAHVPEGADVVVVPALGEPIHTQLARAARLADPVSRTLWLEAPVVNATGRIPDGLSAVARIVISASRSEEAVIDEAAVIADGLEHIVFKRDAGKPSVVIRTPVTLGRRSGGRVEILSGLLGGDEVVASGVYQLKQTGLGKSPQGGHFHADGTWHEAHE